jgi:hypothetical protein
MMDGSSQLALSVGNQIKSVAKAEQDRQLAPQFHPVQQQANRLETLWLGSSEGTALSSRAAWRHNRGRRRLERMCLQSRKKSRRHVFKSKCRQHTSAAAQSRA